MIETERIKLRPVESKDNETIFSYRSDSEANKYQVFIPKTLNEVDEFIAQNAIEFNQSESWVQLVIIKNNRIKL